MTVWSLPAVWEDDGGPERGGHEGAEPVQPHVPHARALVGDRAVAAGLVILAIGESVDRTCTGTPQQPSLKS